MNIDKINIVKNSKPIKIWDLSILIFVVTVSVVAFFLLFNQKGAVVQLWIDGKYISDYNLNHTQSIELDVHLGHMCFSISDGKVFVVHADCDDQICVRMGEIDKVNQTIVC
ncbi:MAG: NusG domain II-containing protein, partial [Firmicutes bacterium]|nr:NusG domain II-containing protein [Bacillota bacterium]